MRLSRHASDEDHVKHLHAATDEEVSLGFLEGPYDEGEVFCYLGTLGVGCYKKIHPGPGSRVEAAPHR